MKHIAKLLVIALMAALVASLLVTPASAESHKYELIREDSAGGDYWTTTAYEGYAGKWFGVLTGNNGYPSLIREYTTDGTLKMYSTVTENEVKDQWLGNYRCMADVLKPNTTYTLTVQCRYDNNSDHALHSSQYADGYTAMFIRYSDDGDVGNWGVIDPSDNYEEYTYTFTTGADFSDATVGESFLQIGPCSAVVAGIGYNNYWGGFVPGGSFEIKSAVIEGDLLKWDEGKPASPSAETADYTAVAVLGTAALLSYGVLVYRSKKH